MKLYSEKLYEAISIRKSVRKYQQKLLTPELMKKVKQLAEATEVLYKDISLKIHIVEDGAKIQKISGTFIGAYGKITAPHYLVATSEIKEGYLENTGYALEYMILALTESGLGTCWIGGYVRKHLISGFVDMEPQHKPIIVVAFGHPEATVRTDLAGKIAGSAKRKPFEELVFYSDAFNWYNESDAPDENAEAYIHTEADVNFKGNLYSNDDVHTKGDVDSENSEQHENNLHQKIKKIFEAARLAPSAMNLQPWRFYYEMGKGKILVHMYVANPPFILAPKLLSLNRVDAGIALCHLNVAIRRFSGIMSLFSQNPGDKTGMRYITSMSFSFG